MGIRLSVGSCIQHAASEGNKKKLKKTPSVFDVNRANNVGRLRVYQPSDLAQYESFCSSFVF